MKYSATISLTLLLTASVVSANLIVDREIDLKSFAEGIPSIVRYTFYNTFGQYFIAMIMSLEMYLMLN